MLVHAVPTWGPPGPGLLGVFLPGTEGYGLWVNADWPSFQTKWKEWSGQGLRLVDFATRATGIEVAASQGRRPRCAEGASYGFAAVAGVTLAGNAAVAASGAGTGVGVGGPALGAPYGSPAGETRPEGFGDAVLGAPGGIGEGAGSPGFGGAVLGATRPGGDGVESSGFGDAVLGATRPAGDGVESPGFGGASGEAAQVDEMSPAGFGDMAAG